MRTILVVLFLATVASGIATSAQEQTAWFEVRQDGQTILGAAFRDAPYRAGQLPAVFTSPGPSDRPWRDAKGELLSGLGFYGWREGTTFRVVVLTVAGNENKPNYQTLATYTLAGDKPVTIAEMKTLGLPPMTLARSAHPRR